MAKIKIGETANDVLNYALQRYCWDKDFSIFTNNRSCFCRDLYYGINWCATGTQTTEKATEFLVNFAFGIELAKAINEADAEWVHGEEFDKIKTREDYEKAVNGLLDSMNAGKFGEVTDWIKSMAA